ncbi:MAG: hypothetical protein M3R08_01385, partial [Bacteroidota bacterium]|nr:hypothetical protein [Bacteroidota bacterium]
MLFLLLLVIGIAFLFLIPAVQTWTAKELGERASKELGAEVKIDRVSIKPFGPIVLQGLYIEDLYGDTLISAGELRVHGLRISPRMHLVQASSLALRDARFALATRKGDPHSNLTNLLKKLASSDTTSAGEDWTIK